MMGRLPAGVIDEDADALINAVGHIEIGAVIGGDFGQQLQQGGAQIVASMLKRK